MADYVKGIQTEDGVKQIDYNALANLPDVSLLYSFESDGTVSEVWDTIEPFEENRLYYIETIIPPYNSTGDSKRSNTIQVYLGANQETNKTNQYYHYSTSNDQYLRTLSGVLFMVKNNAIKILAWRGSQMPVVSNTTGGNLLGNDIKITSNASDVIFKGTTVEVYRVG